MIQQVEGYPMNVYFMRMNLANIILGLQFVQFLLLLLSLLLLLNFKYLLIVLMVNC